MSIPGCMQKSLLAFQIKSIIEYSLQKKEYVQYLPLAKSLKLFSGGKQIAEALGMIMEEDFKANRPLTCAAVISSQTGRPGVGFFHMARLLGYQIPNNPQAEEAFWQNLRKVLGLP